MFHRPFFGARVCPCLIVLYAFALGATEPAATRTLTVAECLQRAAERSPELKSGAYRIEAAARRERLADRPPNPKLEAEAENVAGSGDVSGVDAAETTLAVSQEIELGGKRRQRAEAARAETAVSRAEQDAALQTVLDETRHAALEVLAAQERVKLAEEALALARETESVAAAREQAGKAAALETGRARADTVRAEIDLDARRADQRGAVRALALCWGVTEPDFDALSGPLDAPAAFPPLDALVEQAASRPARRADEARVRAREAAVGLERAARVPNVEVSGGVRHLNESGDVGFVIGAGIELPLFTRGLDGVRAAEADATAARLEADAARLQSEGRIRRLYARFAALTAQAARQREAVLPLTERALAAAQEAHRQGKAGYLDVLEARRALLDLRSGLIDAAAERRAVFNELAFLTGLTD
jgi:cobalt-zinc-cadmium efflux system outer membrane protein